LALRLWIQRLGVGVLIVGDQNLAGIQDLGAQAGACQRHPRQPGRKALTEREHRIASAIGELAHGSDSAHQLGQLGEELVEGCGGIGVAAQGLECLQVPPAQI